MSWLSHVSIFGVLVAVLFWLDGLLPSGWPAAVLISALIATYGLSMWARTQR